MGVSLVLPGVLPSAEVWFPTIELEILDALSS
jgi:hypothetical protein